MKMVIVDQTLIKFASSFSKRATSRFVKAGLLFCFAFILPVSGQPNSQLKEITKAQLEYDNGNYDEAINLSLLGVEKARKIKNRLAMSTSLEIIASAQISLKMYNEAAVTLKDSLQEAYSDRDRRAVVYVQLAWLSRSQRKYGAALESTKKAVAEAPQNIHVLGEHYLNIGRIMFTSGFDISAIIWLEKAEKAFESEVNSSSKIDTYRLLSLAWSAKLNYKESLRYADKWVFSSESSQFKYKHRQALLGMAEVLSTVGSNGKAFATFEKGLKLSLTNSNFFQACIFLDALILNSLHENDVIKATDYLEQLKKYDVKRQFSAEHTLGQAIISAYKNQHEASEKLFAQLDKMENFSPFILPRWKMVIAERRGDWQKVIVLNQEVLELTIKNNFRDALPAVYLDFAKSYFRLNQRQESLENVEKTISFIEGIRTSENQSLSLDLYETYHDAYRLLARLEADTPQLSFELADFLKARLLKDRINGSAMKALPAVSPTIKQTLEELSLRYINDQSVADEIDRNEKVVTSSIQETKLDRPSLKELNDIADLNETAVISYFFTHDKTLMAFVWEKGKPVKTVDLPFTENEADVYARTTHEKIKNFIFFKKDGSELYDKLLKPLGTSAKHLVIVPDKALWKIPFQALSPDGEKYLIETKTISYAPSVSILLDQLNRPKAIRRSLQAFANASNNNQLLKHVNAEANSVSKMYNSTPLLGATATDFGRLSEKFDIIHFSMHAQVSNDQPLESFLSFKQLGKYDGRLTVENLLKVKLKKGSLVFLASCDTNNVLNGEGLVSLAWAMMGSGATTVISAQWEANDKSTEIFTKSFYRFYKQGNSTAEATRGAAIEMIKNKASNVHEPYYWADFTVNGDFR